MNFGKDQLLRRVGDTEMNEIQNESDDLDYSQVELHSELQQQLRNFGQRGDDTAQTKRRSSILGGGSGRKQFSKFNF